MTVVVSIVLAGLAVFAVILPFFRPSKAEIRRNRASAAGGRAPDAAGFTSELESDLRTGIISTDEYQVLRQYYSGRVSAKSGATAPAEQPEVTGDGIERRVRELRQKRSERAQTRTASAKPAQKTNRSAEASGAKRPYVCPKCGHRYKEGDRFCTACGARLTGGER